MVLFFVAGHAYAQDKRQTASVLFHNVNIFDGESDVLRSGMSVLVVGNKISKISNKEITPSENTTVIDAAGRVLMPGMIDAHWHSLMARASMADLMNSEEGYSSYCGGG